MESVQPEEEKQGEFSVKTSEGPTDSFIGPYRCLTDEEHGAIERAFIRPITSHSAYSREWRKKGRQRRQFRNSPDHTDSHERGAAKAAGRS